jgi:hypothetical protein
MITKSEPGIWCDYCKTQWGRVKNVWHEKAMTEASITITSVNPKSHGQKRHYCQAHVLEVTTFTNTTTHEAYQVVVARSSKSSSPNTIRNGR